MSDGAFCHYCQRATCVCRDGFLFDQPKYDDDPMKCVCFNWARIIPAPGDLLTHHKACPMYDEAKVKETEKALRETAWQQTNDR